MSRSAIDRLKRDAPGGHLSRRGFLHRASAAAGLAAAPGLWSGMASAAAGKGGSVRLGLNESQTTDSMDPTRYLTNGDYIRGFAVFNPLVAIDRNQEPVPALATSWEPVSANGDEWRFELRRGVTFHDGKDFSSADVIYSLQRHLRPDSESPGKPLLDQVVEMKADGRHAVHLRTAAPNAELPMLLTQPQFVITPEGVDDFSDPVASAKGTGAYRLRSLQPAVNSSLERSGDSWQDPHLDHIELPVIIDGTARTNALIAGEIDFAQGIDRKVLDLLAGHPNIRVVAHDTSAHFNLVMMVDRGPTDDLDLRTAIKYLIPREQIVQNAFKGYGMIGNDTQVSPRDPFYCKDLPQRPYDPDKARFHLRKAGVSEIELFASTVPGDGAMEACLLLAEAAKAGGLDIRVVVAPGDSYWSAVWMQKPFHLSGWSPRPTADLMLTIANKSDAAWNETQWKNARFDELLEMARGELDRDRRYEMYCEAQTLLHEDGGVGMLGFYNYIDAAYEHIGGFDPHPAGIPRNAFWLSEMWRA